MSIHRVQLRYRRGCPARPGPIHDATLTAAGRQGEDGVFSADPPAGLGTGVPYFRPAPGVPFEF